MVCAVVGGAQRFATSSRVIPRARRTSLIRVIINRLSNQLGFVLSYTLAAIKPARKSEYGGMMGAKLLRERTIEGENSRGPERSGKRPPVRTVTVNVANLRSGGFSPAAS